MNIEFFLEQCSKSSQSAYEAFKELLQQIEGPLGAGKSSSPSARSAIALLHQIARHRDGKYFSLSELKLNHHRLLLLRLPSTFAPEEWSYTFYEGLSRYKSSEFRDRKLVELGCGIGWISIALALKNSPSKVYGLDINPRAILCSRLNLYLNGYNDQGDPIWFADGQRLDQVVEFHVSDLFSYLRQHNHNVDRVIGCIPQVLNPDPEFTSRMLKGDVNENASDEFLHSLSNYAPQQGQIEDQFGLGLIARALEDSIEVLKGTGKIILNLGNRPGKKVLEKLFVRRGLRMRQVWQTRVEQAKDTDISALVEIEKKSSHRFEFYIGQESETPVSAKAAMAYADAGGNISHGLSVYEAQWRDPSHLSQIMKTLRKQGYESARSAMDLSYPEEALFEEKTSFLAALAEELENTDFFPYQQTNGSLSLREHLALYFRNYFRIVWSADHFMMAPSRRVLCRNFLTLYHSGSLIESSKILMDKTIASHFLNDPSSLSSDIIEIPQGSDLVSEMILKLKPKIVVYSMPAVEARTSEALTRLLEMTAQTQARILIDISEFFELSSAPLQTGFFRYLEKNKLPAHAILICSLVKNKIYEDLKLSFVISENQDVLEHLTNAAELTYSRTPFLSQFYYNCILRDLLDFQIFESSRLKEIKVRGWLSNVDDPFIQLSPEVKESFQHPSIRGERVAQKSTDLLRLDYGENCLATPNNVKQILFESFAHKNLSPEECDPLPEIIQLNQMRWQLSEASSIYGFLAGGVAPIFAELARYCAHQGEELLFPQGSYGLFMASAQFHNAKTRAIPTHAENEFKLNLDQLEQTLKQGQGRRIWLILSAPIVNPTGAIYNTDELEAITRVAHRHQCILVLDSIFSGLSFDGSSENMLRPILKDCHWLILGGVSKEFAAGGLRFGYGLTNNKNISVMFRTCSLSEPHRTLGFVAKKLYGSMNPMGTETSLSSSVPPYDSHWVFRPYSHILKKRAERLTSVLVQLKWKVVVPQGGLFLIASPKAWYGSLCDGEVLGSHKLAEKLRLKTGITINSPEWIGIPDYYRFVLSVSEQEFEKALELLPLFFNQLK